MCQYLIELFSGITFHFSYITILELLCLCGQTIGNSDHGKKIPIKMKLPELNSTQLTRALHLLYTHLSRWLICNYIFYFEKPSLHYTENVKKKTAYTTGSTCRNEPIGILQENLECTLCEFIML